MQKVGKISTTIELSRGQQPHSEINQTINNVQLELEGNILNNNITITKNDCSTYLSRDDMKVHIKAIRHTQRYINTVACVKLRSNATPSSSSSPSHYLNNKDDAFTNRMAATSTTAAATAAAAAISDNERLKIKTNLKKSSPNSRKSIDKLYAIRSTNKLEECELNNRMHLKPDNITLTTVECLNRKKLIETNESIGSTDSANGNILMLDNNSSSSTLILKRGKRTLSSTRLEREKSDDNSIKLVRKHPTLRSLACIYNAPGTLSKTSRASNTQKTVKLLTADTVLNKKCKEHDTSSKSSVSNCRSPHNKTTAKPDLSQNIVLRLRKR